jgi:hypothetical protein
MGSTARPDVEVKEPLAAIAPQAIRARGECSGQRRSCRSPGRSTPETYAVPITARLRVPTYLRQRGQGLPAAMITLEATLVTANVERGAELEAEARLIGVEGLCGL